MNEHNPYAPPQAEVADVMAATPLEAAPAQVAIQKIRIRVVGHEDIDQAVVIVVSRDDGKAVGACLVGETERFGGVCEAAIPDVLEKQIGLTGVGPTMMRGPLRQTSVRCARTTASHVVST